MADSDTKVYDGEALTKKSAHVSEKTPLVKGQSLAGYDVTGSQILPGTADNKVTEAVIKAGTIDVTKNYDITYEDGSLTVTQAAIKLELKANGDEKVYDGTPLTASGYEKISGELATGDVIESVSVSGSQTEAGDGTSEITGIVIKHGTEDVTSNYDIAKENGVLHVSERPVTIVADSDAKKYDGTPLTKNSAHVSEATKLAEGHQLTSFTVTGSQTDPGDGDNIPSDAVITAGDRDVTKNYDITYAKGTLTVSDGEIAIRVKAVSDTKVYDGTPLSNAKVELEEGKLAEGDTLTGTAKGSITDKGTTENTITGITITSKSGKDVTDSYIIGKTNGTLEITARPLEITAGSASRTYDGKELTKNSAEITEGSLADGQKLESVTVTGSQTLPGTGINTASDAVIQAGTTNVTDNYEITYKAGTLEITKASIKLTVTAPDASRMYDGEALTAAVCTIGSGLAEGDKVYVNATGSATNVNDSRKGNNPVGNVLVLHNETEDVTANYDIKKVDGTLTITPRTVTLTSASASRAYNGTPLTDGTVTESGDGFVKEEGAVYTVTGSQLEKGSSENSFSYTLKENTKTENYAITTVEGKLEVTASETPITITANDAGKVYDGTALTEAGYRYTEGVLAAGDELTAVVEGSQTEAGSTANKVTSYKVLHDEKDVTASYTFDKSVPGTLTVEPKKVTIKVNSYTKVYGTADPVFDGVVNGLVNNGDLGKIIYARTETDAEKENVNDTISLTASYNANNNYEVTVEKGILTIINSSENAVNAIGQSVVYDGKEYGLKEVSSLRPESTLLYSTDNVTFGENPPIFTEAGTYTVYVKATNPNYNETPVVEGTVVISKREIAITAASAEKRYDGNDLTAPTAEITSGTLAEGQALESVTVAGSQKTTGTSANVASNAVIKAGDADVTANYTITYVDGTLTVTSSGNHNGGNDGGGSTPDNNKPYVPNGPGPDDGPTVTIDPDAVPLANAPVDGNPTDNLILIDDGNVPLAGLPKTGDRAGAQAGLAAILSGFLLAAFTMLNNKKKEDNK